MEQQTATMNRTRTVDYGLHKPHGAGEGLSAVTGWSGSCNWAPALARSAIEGLFGLTVGSMGGWIAGWCCGASYCKYCRPFYMTNLSEVTRWWMMPYSFARAGIVIGAALGLILIALIGWKQCR